MKTCFWNCRGLGRPWAVHGIAHLLRKERPNLVFLFETKRSVAEMEFLKGKLGFGYGFMVAAVGRRGGIACLWNTDVSVNVLSFSISHIDVSVDGLWRCTGFYGNPVVCRRNQSWSLLADLKNRSELPWIVGGDFNEIVSNDEKRGGCLRPERQMESFRMVLEDCGLREIQSEGPWFTWKNNNREGNEIFEKLDRVVVNDSWSLLFPDAAVAILASSISDHLPVMLNTQKLMGWQARLKGFRFENFWVENARCFEVVEQCWENRRSWNDNIRDVQSDLSVWSREEFGSITQNIRQKQSLLKRLLNKPDVHTVSADIGRVEEELNSFVSILDAKWVAGSVTGSLRFNPYAGALPVTVADLILAEDRVWNDGLLNILFSKEQGDIIKSIPLGDKDVEDQWIWEGSTNGIYTVRSGYGVAVKLFYGEGGLSSGGSNKNS
ncbi:hypothetical protein ACFE04_020437 [Oxalis oulophora]